MSQGKGLVYIGMRRAAMPDLSLESEFERQLERLFEGALGTPPPPLSPRLRYAAGNGVLRTSSTVNQTRETGPSGAKRNKSWAP